MIQKIKKPVSILLVFMMIVSLFTVVPITASAAAYYGAYDAYDSNSTNELKQGDQISGHYHPTETEYLEADYVTIVDYNTGDKIASRVLEWTADKDYEIIQKAQSDISGDFEDSFDSAFVYEYTFTIREAKPKYTVTWKNGETTLETDTDVEENSAPSYDGTTPTKAEDDTYTYTFSGWTDGTNTYGKDETLPAVTGDVTYTATFDATAAVQEQSESFNTNQYMHYDEWMEENVADPIDSTNVTITPEDDMFAYGTGWSPASYEKIYFSVKNGNVIRKILITSNSQNAGRCIAGERQITGVKVNNVITYDKVNASSAYVTGIYDAQQITVYFGDAYIPVTWKNGDAVIGTDYYDKGETPTYTGTAPEKAEDEQNTYTFSGWTDGTNTYGKDETLPAVTGDATYTATFDATPKAVPAKLILNVGENGKVVMDNGTFGNATDASNIVAITAPLNVTDGSKVFIVDNHTANLVEGGSINIATGGEVSFYPSADNTGEITAIPDEGYICTGWYNGDTLYSSGAALAYQNISEDITLTAKFERELFWKHSVSLGGDIGVNFYLNPAVLDTYTGAKTVTFTWDGNEITVDVPATATADGYKVTCNVVAAQMAHKIHAVVKAGGTALAQTDDYSVQDYAETVYANPEKYDDKGKPDELKALAKAMLHYGAMAQTVFAGSLEETPDHLADVNVPAADFSGATAENIAAAIKGSAFTVSDVETALGAKFYTSSLIYLSRNTLRLYFTPTTYPGEIPNAGAYAGNLSGYYYYVDAANIPAAELDNQQTFSVNGTEFTFSALDYAKAVVESKMEPEQKNLAKSLYLYNQAANAYFDEPAPAQNIVDLSTVTEDTVVENGYTITGTLKGDYKISIADGATVTLKYVDITCLTNGNNVPFAGITPLGDATIMLEGANTVKGGYEDYPGVFVPVGKTLTINGTGSLNASSNGYGCGIGGGYQMAAGNIVINGGNITAIGGRGEASIGGGNYGDCGSITINGGTVTANCSVNGNGGAGIGSGCSARCGDITINGGTVTANGEENGAGIGGGGWTASCGTITITGGTVEATGGAHGAGIGNGLYSSCGDITIAATVTSVTATKGSNAPNSIGAGDVGSCGTVTIEPGANVIQN